MSQPGGNGNSDGGGREGSTGELGSLASSMSTEIGAEAEAEAEGLGHEAAHGMDNASHSTGGFSANDDDNDGAPGDADGAK